MFRDVPERAVPIKKWDGESGTGKQGRECGDVGRRDARCGTRGSDIGDVNKTYRCNSEKQFTVFA